MSCLGWSGLESVRSEGEILTILTTTISASGHSQVVTSQLTSEPLPAACQAPASIPKLRGIFQTAL